MGPGNQALGYKRIARHLALPIGEVRAAERSIRDKFERYATAARAHEAALERKLGQLLPVPPAAEQARGRLGAWRDVLADWLGRPFASDATLDRDAPGGQRRRARRRHGAGGQARDDLHRRRKRDRRRLRGHRRAAQQPTGTRAAKPAARAAHGHTDADAHGSGRARAAR